jgi:class 3 adenylate cyclase/tetratricopeptide (TPR) repeat protein
MDVGGWLRKLGLEQYEAAFRENRIDDTVLPSLTAEDLKDLGVGFVGDRRKLLYAIAAVRAEASAPTPLSDAPLATDKAAQDTGERRQVTVMFSDLVGSTALSTRMDPEDLREVISAYQKCVAETVRRCGGFVAKYMGDGVLIYFGYPQAHEDDAERAVRAGLELIAAVTALKTSVSLQTRVGIATGLVVVGDLIGSGEAQERGIIGETPNLAARLQGVATPNMVVIADSTRRLLGNLFELEDLGPQDLKGIVGPARAWAALRQSAVESRFEAMHATGVTALVGRDEECELLLRRWSRAKAGEGQVVLLSGEAGIGKSRLTAALVEHLATELHTRLRYFCSAQHADSALYPIIGQMERAAGLGHDDEPRARLDKLDALLAQTFTSGHDIALFADMLSLPNDRRYPALDLTPLQLRQKTLQALISQMEALTRQSTVLMIFEDAHWTDPTSLEVLGLVVERIRTLPVLLIVTFRPEFEPPWIGRPHVTSLTINRFAQREINSLIDRVVGKRMLPPSIRQDIIERTDGIPLFVEEMTKAVLEAESEGEARRTVAVVPSSTKAVPASLHASLMARLDRLGPPAKEVAQIGAAIGREFSHALLAFVVRETGAELESALDRLIQAGLLSRQGVPPYANYLFKHALVQDAAYGTLLREPRRVLHARIAKALEQKFPERASVEPELLARHLTEAGQVEAAISYWLKAGRRCAERSADEEALHHLRRGLEMLMTLPGSTQKDRQELDFQLALGTPLSARHGYPSPLVGAARDRAIALCERLGDTDRLLPSLYGQFVYCLTSGKVPKALEYAERCQSLAAQTGDRHARLIAHRAMGSALLEMGAFEAARVQLDSFLALDSPEKDRPLSAQYVADPLASGLGFLALILWTLGYADKAVAAREKAFKRAVDLNHANTSGFVSIYAGAQLSALLGNVDDVRAHVEDLIARAEGRMPHWGVISQIMMGWALGCAGQPDDGIVLMKMGLETGENVSRGGYGIHWPHYVSLFAILQGRAGNKPESLSAISKARDLIAKTGEYLWHADVLRIEGELGLLFGASTQPSEGCFVQALEVARKQQARSFELRAATSLARLWRDQGKRQQARDLLAPVYGWFTEGFDTLDLKQAKALLDELT